MAKSIASLQAVVGAQIQGFENKMRAVESRTQSTARVINRTKPHMDLDTTAANRKLDSLEKKAKGIQLKGAMNPAMLGTALMSGAIMRAMTQSEEGKRLISALDHGIVSLLSPAIRTLTPVVELLADVIEGLTTWLKPIHELQSSTIGLLMDTARFAGQSFGRGVELWFEASEGIIASLNRAADAAGLSGTSPDSLQARYIQEAAAPHSAARFERTSEQMAAMMANRMTPFQFMFGNNANAIMQSMASRAQSQQRFEQVLGSLQSTLADLRTGGGMAGQIAGLDTAHGQRMGPMFQRIENLQALIAGGGPFVAALTDQLNVARGLVRVSEEQHRAQQQKLTAMNRELQIQQRLTQMRQSAEALNAASLSPLEVFQNRMAELNRMMSDPAVGLTQAGFNTAAAQAFATLQAAMPTAPTQGVGFLQGGSAEAQAAIDAFNRQGGQANVQEQIRALAEAANRHHATVAGNTTEIARALTRNPIVLGAGPRLPRP